MSKIVLKEDDQKVKTIIDYYMLTNKLKDVVRTGWKTWGVDRGRVESVAEHIYGTCMLAVAVWSETLPDVNLSEVLLTLALHETEEIIIGDITLLDSPDKQKLKKDGERATMQVFKDLVAKDTYFKLIHNFNTRSTKEAVFAYKCDKLECDLQARLYSDEGAFNLQKMDKIVEDSELIKGYVSKGINDVADYFILNDRPFMGDTDDIFYKISQYIQSKKIKKG